MKGKVITTCVALVLICIVGGIWWFNHDKGETNTEDQQAAATGEIDYVALLSSNGTGQEIRLPNSEEIVYIEGISEEEAAILDSTLRHYEELLNAVEGEITTIGSVNTAAVEAWLNPEINIVDAFASTEYDATGSIAWLTNPLKTALIREDCAEAFYFQPREGGGYTMSYGYYLIGYVYSGMWQLAPIPQQ